MLDLTTKHVMMATTHVISAATHSSLFIVYDTIRYGMKFKKIRSGRVTKYYVHEIYSLLHDNFFKISINKQAENWLHHED